MLPILRIPAIVAVLVLPLSACEAAPVAVEDESLDSVWELVAVDGRILPFSYTAGSTLYETTGGLLNLRPASLVELRLDVRITWPGGHTRDVNHDRNGTYEIRGDSLVFAFPWPGGDPDIMRGTIIVDRITVGYDGHPRYHFQYCGTSPRNC